MFTHCVFYIQVGCLEPVCSSGPSGPGVWCDLPLSAPDCQEVEPGIRAVIIHSCVICWGNIWHLCHLSNWWNHPSALGLGGKNLVHQQIGFCLLGFRIIREFQLSYHQTVSELCLLKPFCLNLLKIILFHQGAVSHQYYFPISLCNLSSVPVLFVGQS